MGDLDLLRLRRNWGLELEIGLLGILGFVGNLMRLRRSLGIEMVGG